MATYVILSKLSPEAFRDPAEFPKLAEAVAGTIRKKCPAVRWKASYALMGSYDVVDIIESDDCDQAARAAMIIRAHGHAETATMPAIPWKDFLESLKG